VRVGLLTLPANIIPGWNWLLVSNTLAYLSVESETKEKSFVAFSPEDILTLKSRVNRERLKETSMWCDSQHFSLDKLVFCHRHSINRMLIHKLVYWQLAPRAHLFNLLNGWDPNAPCVSGVWCLNKHHACLSSLDGVGLWAVYMCSKFIAKAVK
jgi:hypothetical protein